MVDLPVGGLGKRLACLRQHDSILRALRSGKTRFDRGKVKTQQLGIFRFGRTGVVKKSLLAGVRFDQRDLFVAAAGEFQVAQAFLVDRKNAASRSVLGSHVGDGGAIGEWQVLQAGAEVLDELADNTVLAQHLGDSKNKVGCSGAFPQAAGKLHADDERDQHGDGLSQHGGLGFDAAHAPAQHAQSVHHGGVRVGADKCVGIGGALSAFFILMHKNHARQILEVDLVHDAGVRRYDGKIAEAGLSPAQKRVALFVPLEFKQRVDVEGFRRPEFVDLHRMIDHQFRSPVRRAATD